MTPSAADVGGRFDLVLDDGSGHVNGYVIAKDDQSGLYYRPRRASYSTSPTFVERSNTQGDYGDNQQDFWMTFTQRDWSLGSDQRFFKSNDADKVRRFWKSQSADAITTPGQVSMLSTPATITHGTYQRAVCPLTDGSGVDQIAVALNDSHLWYVARNAVGSDKGVMPLASGADSVTSMCIDSNTTGDVLYSTGKKIGRYDGTTFTQFSGTSGAMSIAYLNNTLYGLGSTTGANSDLIRYDTSGVPSTLFTWKNVRGVSPAMPSARTSQARWLAAFGGKLAILLPRVVGVSDSLWLYDGTAPSKIADFPALFYAWDLAVSNGIIYVAGYVASGVAGSA